MLFPSLDEVLKISENYPVIPVLWEIPADDWSPLQIYAALSQMSKHAFLLEGISTPSAFCRWSYIGCDPHLIVRVRNGCNEIHAFGSTSAVGCGNTEHLVREMLNENRSPVFPDMPAFTGGFAGFRRSGDPLSCTIGLYDEIIAYDHLKSTVVIILNLHKGSEIMAQYQAAEIRAAQIAAEIEEFRLAPQYRYDAPPIRVEITKGCAFTEHAPDSFELYRRIRSRFPSPHLCFFREDAERLAASCTLTAQEQESVQTAAGYKGYNGSGLQIYTEQAVLYADVRNCVASVECAKPEDMQIILELMRSAKLENTSM